MGIRTSAILTTAISAAFVNSANAIVIYDGGTPSDVPNPTWYARYDHDGASSGYVPNATAIVVGPNKILTARHPAFGGGASPNAEFTIPSGANAGTYKVVPGGETNLGANIDARVFTVCNLDNTPVIFSSFANIYTGPLAHVDVAIGGYGKQIGTPLGSGNGYNVTSTPNDNSYNLLQGFNHIYDEDLDGLPTYTPYQDTPFLFADFDGPSGTQLDGLSKVSFEADIADFDSGGGWFVKNGVNWELMGMTLAVSSPGTADFGDLLGAMYLTPYASVIPEPASCFPIAIGAIALIRRRASQRRA